MNYRFIGIDEGKQNIILGDTGSSRVQWKVSLSDTPTARSLQRLDNERVLVGYDQGYFVVRISDGAELHRCCRWKNVTSVSRVKDGRTLVTGQDLEGHRGVTVLTLDAEDRLVQSDSCEGDYVRLMTVVSEDHYLLSTNDRICETGKNLETRRIFRTEGFLHAWQSLPLKNGEILVTAGYGAFVARFSPQGQLLQRFGTAGEVPSEVAPFFYASLREDSRGNLLVANWQDHGPDNGHKGRQLLQFSPEGNYLQGWSFPREISSLQGLLILNEEN